MNALSQTGRLGGNGSSAVVLGGSGFIGRHLAVRLVAEGVREVIVADIKEPRWPLPRGVRFAHCDVRRPIDVELVAGPPLVFNLAAIHRTPGHQDHEYHETNEAGAENATAYCRAVGATRLWFISSIAIYGASETVKTEVSVPAPESAYGQSKLEAERIHREWLAGGEDSRQLVVVRPGTVFGPGEGGNFTRLAGALAGRRFFYPGRRDTLKACGYVSDLVSSMLFMGARAAPLALYNFGYPQPPTIEEVCEAFCEVAGYPRPRVTIPLGAMLFAGRILTAAGLSSYDPDRVVKLTRSTDIVPAALAEAGFAYETDLRQALSAWLAAEPVGRFV